MEKIQVPPGTKETLCPPDGTRRNGVWCPPLKGWAVSQLASGQMVWLLMCLVSECSINMPHFPRRLWGFRVRRAAAFSVQKPGRSSLSRARLFFDLCLRRAALCTFAGNFLALKICFASLALYPNTMLLAHAHLLYVGSRRGASSTAS